MWGGIRFNGVIQHQKHITSATQNGTGDTFVTFDRHVNNSSLQVTSRLEGGAQIFKTFGSVSPSSASQVEVRFFDNNGVPTDTDYDIFGMCPST